MSKSIQKTQVQTGLFLMTCERDVIFASVFIMDAVQHVLYHFKIPTTTRNHQTGLIHHTAALQNLPARNADNEFNRG